VGVTRVVEVAAMKIFNSNVHDRMFVSLGSIKDGRVFAKCQLPGTKVKAGEELLDILHRFIFEELPPNFHQGDIINSVVGPQTETLVQKSREHFVSSIYVRRCFSLTIEWNHSGPVCTSNVKKRGTTRSAVPFGAIFSQKSTLLLDQVPFQNLTVYPVWEETDDHVHLYAWVSQDDFDFFSAPRAANALQSWLSGLVVPPREKVLHRLTSIISNGDNEDFTI